MTGVCCRRRPVPYLFCQFHPAGVACAVCLSWQRLQTPRPRSGSSASMPCVMRSRRSVGQWSAMVDGAPHSKHDGSRARTAARNDACPLLLYGLPSVLRARSLAALPAALHVSHLPARGTRVGHVGHTVHAMSACCGCACAFGFRCNVRASAVFAYPVCCWSFAVHARCPYDGHGVTVSLLVVPTSWCSLGGRVRCPRLYCQA
jgi:hypothetical protein